MALLKNHTTGISALRCITLSLLLSFMLPLNGMGAEADIKAAFLYNVLNYVTWPQHALGNETMVIGLLGASSPLSVSIKRLQDKSVQNRRILVRQVVSLDDLKGSNILIVLPSEQRHLSEILLRLRKEPVLTVSEIEKFSKLGGMVYLTVNNNHPAFGVNLRAVHTAGLEVSSHLLKLAHFVIR